MVLGRVQMIDVSVSQIRRKTEQTEKKYTEIRTIVSLFVYLIGEGDLLIAHDNGDIHLNSYFLLSLIIYLK